MQLSVLKSLTRQLKEAVMLQSRPNSLNSKGEFGACTIPRLVIEEDSYRQKVKEIEEKAQEEEDERKWKYLVDRVKKNTIKRKMPSDCSALKEGGRGKRKKVDETKMMGAVAKKEHLGTLANNRKENQHRGTRGVVGGTLK